MGITDLMIAACVGVLIGFYLGMVFTCWYFDRK